MDDDLMFEYLVQMGAMRPEEAELKRRQAQVEALRKGAMNGPEGQMIGKHYVAPSITQYMAQLGQGYMAGQGQKDVNAGMTGLNERQRMALEQLRKRKMQPQYQAAPVNMDPYSNLPTYGNEA
jgi:hypothetical protein